MASCLMMRKDGVVVGQSAWPNLPPELLERIVAVLAPLDRVAVRLVCASWRACMRESFPSDPPFEVPRLLIRRPDHGGELALFSLRHRKILPFALPIRIRSGRCCGHVAGWLAMAFDSPRTVVLCNPVSGRSVDVPAPPVFPVKKMVLSGPPTSPGWVAAVLGSTGTIALLQPAVSGAWMTIGIKEGEQHGGFRDLAFWRGQLCALGQYGAVFAFRSNLRARVAAVSLLRDAESQLSLLRNYRWQLYLVEMEGELLMEGGGEAAGVAGETQVGPTGRDSRAGAVRGVGGLGGGAGGGLRHVGAARELRLLRAGESGDAGAARHLRVLPAGRGDERRARRRRTRRPSGARLDHPVRLTFALFLISYNNLGWSRIWIVL